MELHDNAEVFSELVAVTAEAIGLPQVYVEKDYWVTKALKYLSESQFVNEVVFKGGTSLSKAYKLIHRFSEDIDLALLVGNKADAAQKKLLKGVEGAVAQGLIYLKHDARESKGSKYRKTVYRYPRNIKSNDFGQASSELLIEINAFSKPEPFESRELQTLIAEVLAKKGEFDLITQYALKGFSVNVLSVRRTLVEKILGVIKDSYNANPIEKLSNRIRHLYDICLILKHEEHRAFIESDEFKELCELCIVDEKSGFFTDADCFALPLFAAPIFFNLGEWCESLNITYKGAFSDMVYGDLPAMSDIEASFDFIRKNLK